MWKLFACRPSSQSLLRLVSATAICSGILAFPMLHHLQHTRDSRPSSPAQTRELKSSRPVHFLSSGLSRTLCEAAPVSEELTFKKMEIPVRGLLESHAIFGFLLKDDAIESYDIYKRPEGHESENVAVAFVKFGNNLDGFPGMVHGGILSMVADDVLGFGNEVLGIRMAFTANLSVNYRAPVPAGKKVRVAVQFERREGRKLFWKVQMTSPDQKTLYVDGTSLYIIPRSQG